MEGNTGILMLSILTPTIPERKTMFNKLKKEVLRQVKYCKETHPTLGNVEFVWDKTKKFLDGGLSIGQKRQVLLDRAQGKYLCFLDDDESIAPNYVEQLLRLTFQDKDVCTFRNISKFDNYWCLVDLSLSNPNEQTGSAEIVKRKPWHICPVKTEYARIYRFPDSNYGEDWSWFEKVLDHCYTESKTNIILHQYNHSSKVSEADKIVQFD